MLFEILKNALERFSSTKLYKTTCPFCGCSHTRVQCGCIVFDDEKNTVRNLGYYQSMPRKKIIDLLGDGSIILHENKDGWYKK